MIEYPLKAKINGYETFVLIGGLVSPIKWTRKLTTSELVDIVNFQIHCGGKDLWDAQKEAMRGEKF